MTQVHYDDTLVCPWAITDEDIVQAYESEPQYWQHDYELPDGLEEDGDGDQSGAPREGDDPRQTCLPWRRPAEKPAWLVRLTGQPVRASGVPEAGRETPVYEAPLTVIRSQVGAVFRGLVRVWTTR